MKQKLKNTLRIVYAAAVCGILAVPGTVLAANSLRSDSDASEEDHTENRVLAEKPSLKTEEGKLNTEFPMQYEAWFSDHFGLRSDLVTAYGDLTNKVFGVSSEADVIIGKNDWLYFAKTIPDATNVRTLSDTEIRHIAYNLKLVSDYAETKGTKFVFAPAPNKASIYPQNLPARYLKAGDQNNLDALYDVLAHTDVTVCDWRGVLREQAAHGPYQLYHKLDTHWNGDGAMLGYQTLLQTLGLDDFGFGNAPRTETCDWSGDLWGMLSPAKENPDQNAVYEIPHTYQDDGRMRSVDDLKIQTYCENGSESLLMFRDSFGRALIPLLSERFASCTYLRSNAIQIDLLESAQADYAVYELVERNLDHLLIHTPKMPAPPAALLDFRSAPEAEPVRMNSESDGTYRHVYGLFDAEYSEVDAVYLRALCSDGTQDYVAFLCCEQEALELDAHQPNGFSAYLPEDQLVGCAAIEVIVQKGSEYIRIGAQALY